MKNIALTVALVLGLLAIPFFGVWYSGILMPMQEQVRREVFEQTEAFVRGKMNDLSRYATQYAIADEAGKNVIAALVRQEFSVIDTSEYPAALQNFLRTVNDR